MAPSTARPAAQHEPASAAVGWGLFAISAALLTLEILQTRLFSYCLDSLLFYAAVGIALLGMGASGTLLTLWSGWRKMRVETFGALAAAGFAISVVATHAVFARVSQEISFGWNGTSAGVLALSALPYVFAGAAITACLSRARARIHGTYFVNLLGSAVGCFVVFLILKPLGAPVVICVVALLGAIAAGLFARGGHGVAKAATVIAVLASLAPLASVDRFFPLKPEPGGQLQFLVDTVRNFGLEEEQVYAAWDPTGRIEIHRFGGPPARLPDPVPYMFYSQDGHAGSLLLGVGDDLSRGRGFFERTLYGAAYQLRGTEATEKVLIIGLGGSPDVQTAHYYGAASITGVDINASAIEALRGPLAAFTGDPYERPGVDVHRMDGRSFVRATDARYDLIVMTGVDTKAIHAAGSLAISENNLYTVEAFGEYLDHLEPGGHLALLRFGANDRIRLTAIGVEALKLRGAKHPENHLAILAQQHWTSVIIGRDPLSSDELARLRAWVAAVPEPDTGIWLPPYEAMDLRLGPPPVIFYPLPEGEEAKDVGRYLEAVVAGRVEEYLDTQISALAPTTDDRPFFFDSQRRDRLFSHPTVHYQRLGAFLGIATLLAALAIALPVPAFLRQKSRTRQLPRTVLYFVCLGAGFMLLEIGLVQKLVLFLGHQSYAITVVLATLLVSAGLGSATAGALRIDAGRLVRWIAIPLILLFGAGLMVALDRYAVAGASLSLIARIGVTALALFPMGFVLGIPFPSGLARLQEQAPTQLPWAIAANSFASVVGASAALPLAMLLGYRTLILLSFAIYIVAALCFPRAQEVRAQPASSGD